MDNPTRSPFQRCCGWCVVCYKRAGSTPSTELSADDRSLRGQRRACSDCSLIVRVNRRSRCVTRKAVDTAPLFKPLVDTDELWTPLRAFKPNYEGFYTEPLQRARTCPTGCNTFTSVIASRDRALRTRTCGSWIVPAARVLPSMAPRT